jgi:ADP-ribose pyrophosphatase YjhB (NUDIX family)
MQHHEHEHEQDHKPKRALPFCMRCGTRMEEQEHEGQMRPVCPACGFILFRDPKVATGVIVERAGRVLMVQRNHYPRLGLWSFPSGYVDQGERVESAAARETWEEAGIRVSVDALLGVFSEEGNPAVFIAYTGTILEGEPEPGPESRAVAFFAPDDLPPLAFDHDREIVDQWVAQRQVQEPARS